MSNQSKPTTKPPSKPMYISSSGQALDSLPLMARLNHAADDIYNFLGLYFVSLLSLDPYTSAQNSRFNTRGPGRNVNSNANAGRSGLGYGSARAGSGSGTSGGPRGSGSGGGTGGSGGRRMGTVDDVRGPECGSCG